MIREDSAAHLREELRVHGCTTGRKQLIFLLCHLFIQQIFIQSLLCIRLFLCDDEHNGEQSEKVDTPSPNLLETNKILSPRHRPPTPRLYQQRYDHSTVIILRYTSKHVFKLHFLQ